MNSAVVRRDLAASIVVFLVALPLCVGVAVASGVPAELGLVTGIVGGLVTGLLPGSSLQVSGPAAGLTLLVYETVQRYGMPVLGIVVLIAGLLQLALGALNCGRWFRAISTAVVEGMLAGIGLVIIAGQLYAMADTKAPKSGLDKIAGLPRLADGLLTSSSATAAFAVGAVTIAVMFMWQRMPVRARVVPGALVAVAVTTLATWLLDLPIQTITVHGLIDSIRPLNVDAFGQLDPAMVGTVIAFALIASAESLFSAAAVDRLHDGPPTDYDKELMAQGVGNAVCGLLGALPITAVIVRSAANVQAGAQTKVSRVLHGVWLLLFAALLPAVLGIIPVAALAGVLVHAGFKLLPLKQLPALWRAHRSEAAVLATTAAAILTVGMFEGVLIGLALAVVKAAWETSSVQLDTTDTATGPIQASLSGNATFLGLPQVLHALEALPKDRPVELDLSGLHHLDHTCRTALIAWVHAHNAEETGPLGTTPSLALTHT